MNTSKIDIIEFHYKKPLKKSQNELVMYLRRLIKDNVISRKVGQESLALWFAARDVGLPVPAACSGPDGQMCYSWDKGRHHFEAEITPNEPVYLFYRDRDTESIWGEEHKIGDKFSEEALQKISLLWT